MPPRLRVCLRCLRNVLPAARELSIMCGGTRRASALAITPAVPLERTESLISSDSRYPTTQPPSYRRPDDRRSQLHRQYTSLLRSTPMMLIFQHNNITATELLSLRRELAVALAKVDHTKSDRLGMADTIRLHIVRGGVFGAALRVVEFYRSNTGMVSSSNMHIPSTTHTLDDAGSSAKFIHTSALSRAAYEAVANRRLTHTLTPLLSGPLAVVTFPGISTEHLKAALSVLAPKSPEFPAPTRRVNPSYWEPSVQSAVLKLMLLGARIESRVLDTDGARLVGGIHGGLSGLRSQMVAMLQGFGGGVTSALESAGKNLFLTVEGQRSLMEEESRNTR